jgi:hypothetical protein
VRVLTKKTTISIPKRKQPAKAKKEIVIDLTRPILALLITGIEIGSLVKQNTRICSINLPIYFK